MHAIFTFQCFACVNCSAWDLSIFMTEYPIAIGRVLLFIVLSSSQQSTLLDQNWKSLFFSFNKFDKVFGWNALTNMHHKFLIFLYFYEINFFFNHTATSIFGVRHLQALLLFLALSLAYALRVNLSVAIVAITDKNAANPDFEVISMRCRQNLQFLDSFWLIFIFSFVGNW